MDQLQARYPDDHEAAIFYALGLLATAAGNRQNVCESEKGWRDP